jgi:hypothetical protein
VAKSNSNAFPSEVEQNREKFMQVALIVTLEMLSKAIGVKVTLPAWLQIGFGWLSSGAKVKGRCKGLSAAAWSAADGVRQYTVSLAQSVEDGGVELISGLIHAIFHLHLRDENHGDKFAEFAVKTGFAGTRLYLVKPAEDSAVLANLCKAIMAETEKRVGYALPVNPLVPVSEKNPRGTKSLRLQCVAEGKDRCSYFVNVTEHTLFGGKTETKPRFPRCGIHVDSPMILDPNVVTTSERVQNAAKFPGLKLSNAKANAA